MAEPAAAAAPAEAVEESEAEAEAEEEEGWPNGNCGGGADGSGLCCCCCSWREGSGDSLLKLRRPLRLLGMGGSPCRAAAIRLIVGESLFPLHSLN